MKKLAFLAILVGFAFAEHAEVPQILQFKTPFPDSVSNKEISVVDFCVHGLLYRGFQAKEQFSDNKIVLDPASFHQVIGRDGKPMTCNIIK